MCGKLTGPLPNGPVPLGPRVPYTRRQHAASHMPRPQTQSSRNRSGIATETEAKAGEATSVREAQLLVYSPRATVAGFLLENKLSRRVIAEVRISAQD